MWVFNKFYILIIVYLGLSSLAYLSYFIHNINTFYHFIRQWALPLLRWTIGYTIILTLKEHKEKKWRLLPFYFLLVEQMAIFLFVSVALPKNPQMFVHFHKVAGLTNIITCLYMLISTWLIKNSEISIFFKLYSGITMFSVLLSFCLPTIFFLLFSWTAFIFSFQLINGIIIFFGQLNLIPLLLLYVKLHKKMAHFAPGDIVGVKKPIQGIDIGASGIVVAKHADDYYDVDFFDNEGNLLNVITISATDTKHVDEPDLQTRVKVFGA